MGDDFFHSDAGFGLRRCGRLAVGVAICRVFRRRTGSRLAGIIIKARVRIRRRRFLDDGNHQFAADSQVCQVDFRIGMFEQPHGNLKFIPA